MKISLRDPHRIFLKLFPEACSTFLVPNFIDPSTASVSTITDATSTSQQETAIQVCITARANKWKLICFPSKLEVMLLITLAE